MCLLACMQNASSSEENCVVSSDALVDNYPEYKQLVDDVRMAKQPAGLPLPAMGIFLLIGSPCNSNVGFCDLFLKCRSLGVNNYT